MKRFLYILTNCFLFYSNTFSQVDSIESKKGKIYLLGGICNTLSNNSSSQSFFNPGINLSFNNCLILSENLMFQTGLEYDRTKYFIAQFYTIPVPSHDFSNMNFHINTFSIPLYLNLFLYHQKLFVGGGGGISVLPNSKADGYSGQIPVKNITWLINPIDIGVGAKAGYFFKAVKSEWVIEGKITYGLLNLIPKYGPYPMATLHNNYFVLSLGYVFK